jgi:UDP-glucose:(heptosyl)LPS alpha-1,3-glucosyltransferase
VPAARLQNCNPIHKLKDNKVKQLRIALIIEDMNPSRGGRETSTAQITEALVAAGHDLTILCQTGSWDCDGVEIRPLGRRGVSREQRFANFVRDAQKAFLTDAFDIVHAVLPVPGVDVYQPRGGCFPAQFAGSRRRKPPLGRTLSAIGLQFNAFRKQLANLESRVFAESKTIVAAVSEMVAEEIRYNYYKDRSDENLRVVFNGVDVPDIDATERSQWRSSMRKTHGIEDDEVVFLTVAKNYELKGIPHAIRNFATYQQNHPDTPNARLVIVGRENPSEFRRQAKSLGVDESVLFVPPTKDIFPWYSASDVCILLSWYDACSRVILEATRWGIPSITTTYNGAAEILTNGAGIVVERPDDDRSIVAGMTELSDPQKRLARSRIAAEISDDLSMVRHAERLIVIYREILEKR